LVGSAGPRYFGFVIGGALPAAAGADWLTTAWAQNAVLHAASPAAAGVEEVAGRWMLELLGLPVDASIGLPTGAGLGHAVGRAVVVCAQAGNVNSGAFDPIGEMAALLAPLPNAWLHVDGAFGLWAAAVPRLRQLVAGIENADSWSTDAHKWLNVGYDCGFVAV